jgi:hypothetical protein
MSRKKTKGTELSVFKGREAKLNRAILQTYGIIGPLTIYDLHKKIKTRIGLKRTYYANVNKRVRSLERLGYLKIVGSRRTKAGIKVSVYELTARAILALFLNSINIENLLDRIDEESATEILAVIAGLDA